MFWRAKRTEVITCWSSSTVISPSPLRSKELKTLRRWPSSPSLTSCKIHRCWHRICEARSMPVRPATKLCTAVFRTCPFVEPTPSHAVRETEHKRGVKNKHIHMMCTCLPTDVPRQSTTLFIVSAHVQTELRTKRRGSDTKITECHAVKSLFCDPTAVLLPCT